MSERAGEVGFDRCVICYVSTRPGDGGLCPDHKYDEQRLALVAAECDLAEQEARHVVDDEVYVSVGLIRNALNGVSPAPPADTTATGEGQ